LGEALNPRRWRRERPGRAGAGPFVLAARGPREAHREIRWASTCLGLRQRVRLRNLRQSLSTASRTRGTPGSPSSGVPLLLGPAWSGPSASLR
jgi:hypothetical protein